jgi:Cft2 family RNA processing exonuclease
MGSHDYAADRPDVKLKNVLELYRRDEAPGRLEDYHQRDWRHVRSLPVAAKYDGFDVLDARHFDGQRRVDDNPKPYLILSTHGVFCGRSVRDVLEVLGQFTGESYPLRDATGAAVSE